MTTHLIVGTAGHIDHGKTALVKALSGVDADRLPEEKQRGMTVDLGFASLDLEDFRLGIVDVPGHERLVRNMLAGAMAIDLALLVIAATESIKPQTREHLEILKHAGIEHGVIALTKCDLADSDWIELVEQEVGELVEPTFLRDAPLVRVSATKGTGLDGLRHALVQAARQAAASSRRLRAEAPFWLGVDRAFTVDGHGTVVTGSVASGRLRVGQEVTIAPHGTTARIRGLQSYNKPAISVERGQRAAINLVGVPLRSIRRGDIVAQDGWLTASDCLCAQLEFSPEHRARCRKAMPVRVYLGTAEVHARLRWLQQPGDDGDVLAELRTDRPVAPLAGQPLVIRDHCGSTTLGGGRVLDPMFRAGLRPTARDLQQLRRLASPDPLLRVAAALYLSGISGFQDQAIARRAGHAPPPTELLPSLLASGDAVRLELGGGRQHVLHTDVLESLMQRAEQLLDKRHRRNPLQAAFPAAVLQKIFEPAAVTGLLDAVVARMVQEGRVLRLPAGLALPGYAPKLSKAQQRQYERIVQLHREANFAPPSLDELVATATSHRDSIPKLVELAVAQGHLMRVCAQWCLHWEVAQEMQITLQTQIGEEAFTVSDLRELLHTSRKYLVPLCEHLDRIGFTRRDGDLRRIVTPIAPRVPECSR